MKLDLSPAAPPAPLRPLTDRSAWHLRANAPVVAWLVATVVVAVGHRWIPASPWLLVHLLLLGAVTNAICVWSQHFTDALLRRRITPASRRWQVARLVLLNGAVAATVAGMVTATWVVTLVGAVGVGVAVAAHGTALWLQSRQALAARFAICVGFYVAAAWLLPFGAGLGATLARGLDEGWHTRVVLAHAGFNLLGFVGLTVMGTLMTLWPTMLRTKMADDAPRAARTTLALMLVGLAGGVAAVLAASPPVAAVGLATYLAGIGVSVRPMVTAARRRPPATFATWSAACALAWLVGSLATLVGVLALSGTWEAAAARVGIVTVPLVAGFAAQVLLGALTYLVPVVLGGGPAAVRSTTAVLERGAVLRVVLFDGALALFVLPAPSLVHVLASLTALGALVAFLPLLVGALRVHRRARRTPFVPPTAEDVAAAHALGQDLRARSGDARQGPPVEAVTGPRRKGLAVAALSVLLLVAAGGVALDPAALGTGTGASPTEAGASGAVVPTGRTTTVEVEARDMRFFPATIEVPAGDSLVLVVTNTDSTVHDLVLDTGATSGRLSPGATETFEVGVVGRTVDGWCSIVGHRQMGMVLTIEPVGGSVGGTSLADGGAEPDGAGAGSDSEAEHDGMAGMDHGPVGSGDESGAPSAAKDLDFMATPGDDFVARPAELAPASTETVHRVRLAVSELVTEVAPGVTQTLWTFGGTAPGPTLRGKVGDRFEITLVNDGTIGHSIDFHAGALAPDRPMRTIAPGEELTYTFTATMSGVWMYHCSTMPMSAHIANGMFGAVVIDPPDLPAVDREYLIVQSEYYLGPQGGEVDMDRLATGDPDVVAFNGYANQYDAAPLPARVGERVRVWVLAAGPNRGSAFHVVGGQFDTVFSEGAYRLRPGNAEAGGSQVLGLAVAQGGFVELAFPEAGRYPFVTHAMIDAERGAHGFFAVTG
ncbi:multicopper oxidase domain-containing protein [Oerskovia enterophila]|uniref:Copper-containing nitrite reductase n=1 Tax=Oerskovia enterophila TaxID=43678 RepID=A0ABX2XZX2_9CELL|nr:multicopper oxidase domain-containing protein [Oerskovia enterophila]OCI29795.1 copper-containing nitrite reductase precursor [Oerskovia enterophila]